MHAHDLARLAAVAAVHGQQLAAASPEKMDQMLAIYWRASRCRLDRWCHSLHAIKERSQSLPLPKPHFSSEQIEESFESQQQFWSIGAAAIVEEILVSEILTRTLAAITAAHDGLSFSSRKRTHRPQCIRWPSRRPSPRASPSCVARPSRHQSCQGHRCTPSSMRPLDRSAAGVPGAARQGRSVRREPGPRPRL